jgi:predicted nucleic acid-binding protein
MTAIPAPASIWQNTLDTPFANTEVNSPYGAVTFTAWDSLGAVAAVNAGYRLIVAQDFLNWVAREKCKLVRGLLLLIML